MTRATTASRALRNSRQLLAAGWLLLVAASASAQPALATRIEGVAAAIGGASGESTEVILQSDVELRARMLLLGRDRDQALYGELPQALLSAALRELIGERLIAREAERVQVTRPTQAMVQQEKQRLLSSAGGIDRVFALLDLVGAAPAELDGMAERRALVGAFLRANLEGTSVITDREIDDHIARDRARYAERDPLSLRAEVRALLARTALARNIERWVRVLRARVPVRIYAAFESP